MGTNRKRKTPSLRNYVSIILPLAALMIVPFGCVHRPQVKAPLSPKFTEAELGRVAVVSASFEPDFGCPYKPMTKAKAAGLGALIGFSIGGAALSGNPLGVALVVGLSPVIAAGGAIYGAIEGKTTKTVRKTMDILNYSLATSRAQEVIHERVLSLARERSRCTFVVTDHSRPNVLDEETSYDSLNGKGVDTVLEISVRYVGLWREKHAIDPPLSLFMTVSIRLIRVKDGEVLSSRTFFHESEKKRKLTKWAKNGAQPFKEELDRCFKSLAETIVVELLVS
jgi:hypothetical protein